MKGVGTMQLGWHTPRWRISLTAAFITACLLGPSSIYAGEGAVTGGELPPQTSRPGDGTVPQGNDSASESASQEPAPDSGSASPEPKAADEPLGQTNAAAQPSSPPAIAAPTPGALPVFELQGLFIGMPLSDAENRIDDLLGVESTVRPEPGGSGLQVGHEEYVWVTGDRHQGVVRIEFFQKLIDAVYGTERLRSKDFAERFSAAHEIFLEIEVTRRHTAWKGRTPDGLHVTITSTDSDNKILVIEKP
jgi:hypothetical protein